MRNIFINNCFGKSKIGDLSHHICCKKNVATLYIAMMEGTQPVCKYSNPAQNKIWIQNIPNKLSYELVIFIGQLLSLIELKMKFIIDIIDVSLLICDVKIC